MLKKIKNGVRSLKSSSKRLVAFVACPLILLSSSAAMADSASPEGLKGMASSLQTNLEGMVKVLTAVALLAGIICVVTAIMKFVRHSNNPQQERLAPAVTTLFVGFGLIFFPAIIGVGGMSLFGSAGNAASFSGNQALSNLIGDGGGAAK